MRMKLIMSILLPNYVTISWAMSLGQSPKTWRENNERQYMSTFIYTQLQKMYLGKIYKYFRCYYTLLFS